MTDHTPCEHCEEVRQDEEDKVFGTALSEGLKAEKGTLERTIADLYMEDLLRPINLLPTIGSKEGVTFKYDKEAWQREETTSP